MADIYSKRFKEISDQMDAVGATRSQGRDSYGDSYDRVNNDQMTTWTVRAESLIANACGADSEHLRHFVKGQEWGSFETGYGRFARLRAIFLAAKADFDGGYLTSLRSIVQAEVFSDELEQAVELLKKGYKAPAAVIAGVVLETSLRELCDRRKLSRGKIDKMNADLAKDGAYNLLQQKRITALAQIRNDAAHGNWNEFSDADVKGMMSEIERLLNEQLG